MMMMGLDREVEKCVNELQKKHNCIILLSNDGIMDIMFLATGEHKTEIVRITNKCAMMLDIRKAFK